jgi:hypothetical protein
MPAKIRILSSANKTMQRLGYLKLLAQDTARTETSNVASLGQRLISTVIRRVKVSAPFDPALSEYVRIRLFDRVYADLRKQVLDNPPAPIAAIELQDLYLADPRIPSTTGKLIENDWRFYTYLGTALDFIKPGTWSAMTRSLTFLALTSRDELAAFEQYDPRHNPMLLSKEQAALLLYCVLDNDAEILQPLFQGILSFSQPVFDEREAGDLLPDIIKNAAATLSKGSLVVEDKERLSKLEKVAANIERQRGKPYSGSGAREGAIRVRLEPFCDLGLLTKPERHHFAYKLTPAFHRLMVDWPGLDATDFFLENRFFTALAGLHGLQVADATDEDARAVLHEAGAQLSSTLGYSPIKDVSLLAGIRLLFTKGKVLELGRSHDILRAWQKAAPDIVRFTVDRMGDLAYVKFIKPATPPKPSKPNHEERVS